MTKDEIEKITKEVEDEVLRSFDENEKKKLGFIHIYEEKVKENLAKKGIQYVSIREKYKYGYID